MKNLKIDITQNITYNKSKDQILLTLEFDKELGLIIWFKTKIEENKDKNNDMNIEEYYSKLSLDLYFDIENKKDLQNLNKIVKFLKKINIEQDFNKNNILYSSCFLEKERTNWHRTINIGCNCVGWILEHSIIIENNILEQDSISIQFNYNDFNDSVLLWKNWIEELIKILDTNKR